MWRYHGYSDRRTQQFFIDRDYPEAADLVRVFQELDTQGGTRDSLGKTLQLDVGELDGLLNKLSLHGGAHLDAGGAVQRGSATWEVKDGAIVKI